MKISIWEKILKRLSRLSTKDETDYQFNQREELVIASSILFAPTTFILGILYISLGETISGLIPLAYSLFLSLTFILFIKNRKTYFLSFSHQILTLLLPLMMQLSLGGYVQSSSIILWSFSSPLTALLTNKTKIAFRWFIAFLLNLIIGGILDPYFVRENNISPTVNIVLFVLNIMMLLGISFTLLLYMVNQRKKAYRLLNLEQGKSEALLLNILPEEIAYILKNENRLVADAFPEASILFADIVEFTSLSNQLSPIEIVTLLNDLYSHFDILVDKHGLEKIKTIGDNYMVAAGIPVSRSDHAQALAEMALGINSFIDKFPPVKKQKLQFRIGINSGPVVAGVVGKKKFQYDVWGDTVNIASRAESYSEPGKIQVTKTTYQYLKDDYLFDYQGKIEVKGKGVIETWFLTGRK